MHMQKTVLQTKPRMVDSACELPTALWDKRFPYIMPLYVSEGKVEFMKTSFPRNNMHSGLLTVEPPDGSFRCENT